jgi:predicted MFS family arabinose efflux permease
MASLSDITPRDQRAEALSLHMVSANIMKTTGPVLGGFLIAAFGVTVTFIIGSLTYLPAILVLFLWKPPPREYKPGTTVFGAVTEGFSYLKRARHIHPVLQRVFLFGLCFNGIIALLPLIARDQIGGESSVYGTLYGGIGLGAIFAGFLLSPLRRILGVSQSVTVVISANALAILVLALSHNVWLSFAACFIAGVSWLTNQTLLNTTLQLASPARLVGRMAAMHLTFTYLGLSLGSWIWGAVADLTSTQTALILSAAAMIVTALLGLWLRLPDISGPDTETAAVSVDV